MRGISSFGLGLGLILLGSFSSRAMASYYDETVTFAGHVTSNTGDVLQDISVGDTVTGTFEATILDSYTGSVHGTVSFNIDQYTFAGETIYPLHVYASPTAASVYVDGDIGDPHYPYASLTGGISAGVDATTSTGGGMVRTVEGQNNYDITYAIDTFTLPEPSAVAFVSLAGTLILLRRRSKNT